jgi:hypothetical protein
MTRSAVQENTNNTGSFRQQKHPRWMRQRQQEGNDDDDTKWWEIGLFKEMGSVNFIKCNIDG